MGNEVSNLTGLEVEEKPTEITDFWSHYHATLKDSCKYFSIKGDGSVSVFKGEAVLGPLWTITSPLEKCSNNLLKYRHPCILRYVSAWQQRSVFHLATEYCQPLSQVLLTQTPLQICVGLNEILRALVFLHEQAKTSHNNVSISAIYVTADGHWKLGGLHYLCPFKELTLAYLKQARIYRYDKAVDPNEDNYESTTKVDQYAFAVLVDDVFKGRRNDDVPHLAEFKKYCTELLQHEEPSKRPELCEVLKHSFFNHEFIMIYKFFTFIALKSEEEKMEFFSTILTKLRHFDETTVAKQLGGLLLSRLAMLDQTARKELIPFVLKPRNDRCQSDVQLGLFSMMVFKEHIKPRLMQLFGVRDSQIRLFLLAHFNKYVQMFTHEELSQHILPELLLGIKDTDDNLVASTLVCLSELVPILGANTVIGVKRSKIFSDGRPYQSGLPPSSSAYSNGSKHHSKSLKEFNCTEEVTENNELFDNSVMLNERPTPVGGESNDTETRQSHVNISNPAVGDIEDTWSDWDETKPIEKGSTSSPPLEIIEVPTTTPQCSKSDSSRAFLLQKAAIEAKKNIRDISELDIKTQRQDHSRSARDDVDFFADMAPVIEKSTFAEVKCKTEISDKLNFVPDSNEEHNGAWGDDWSE